MAHKAQVGLILPWRRRVIAENKGLLEANKAYLSILQFPLIALKLSYLRVRYKLIFGGMKANLIFLKDNM